MYSLKANQHISSRSSGENSDEVGKLITSILETLETPAFIVASREKNGFVLTINVDSLSYILNFEFNNPAHIYDEVQL